MNVMTSLIARRKKIPTEKREYCFAVGVLNDGYCLGICTMEVSTWS